MQYGYYEEREYTDRKGEEYVGNVRCKKWINVLENQTLKFLKGKLTLKGFLKCKIS